MFSATPRRFLTPRWGAKVAACAVTRTMSVAVWCATTALAACTLGPRYHEPTADVPANYGALPAPVAGTPTPLPAGDPSERWWSEFHDPELDRLEDRVGHGNLDLQAALLRIVEARTQVQAARAQGLPTLNGSASYNREQLGLAGILKAQGLTGGGSAAETSLLSSITAPVNLYQVGFDASWELDLFGKVRRGVEAAKAQSDVAVEQRHDLQVTLAAEVAETYMQLRAAQVLEGITEGLVGEEREILELTVNRQAHGLTQEMDVESARGQLSNLLSQLPQFQQNIAVSRHALAVLIGESPDTLDAELAVPTGEPGGSGASLPTPPSQIRIGLPSTLARRRPDIRQAEASLHAATAQVGVSVASMYPDFSLTGSAGLRNTSTRYLFDWASKFYSAGPSISVPIFEGGALVANVRMARAEEAAAALDYRKTVLTALQDVEDGLVNLEQDALRVKALDDTVDADQRSFDIARHSYDVGLTTYISVLNAELQANQARQQRAQASLTQLSDMVKLYKALGGGWSSDPQTAAN